VARTSNRARFTPPAGTTIGAYGELATDRRTYRPLDPVTVTVRGRDAGDTAARLRVCDPEQRVYAELDVPLTDNVGVAQFIAGGALGNHYVYLTWPDEPRHSRYLNFRLEAETIIETGDADFDTLYPTTRDLMRLGRREYRFDDGPFVGYIAGDTMHFDGIWLRDFIHGLPAFQHWETRMQCGLDRFFARQRGDGMLPDGIERDGRTWRVELESDVEYIAVLGVWQAWRATGDDPWLEKILPKCEKALEFIRSSRAHWDAGHRLVKRQHSCDTWDFDADGFGDSGQQRHVVATCDQSGYYLAYRAMSAMHAALENESRASFWSEEAEACRTNASALLWDGVKFQHHHHLDPIEHGDFDESDQLAMGNTWAMTRGLAGVEQAQSIIAEYQRRQAATGDAYPWWSLQPGYPDHLNYWQALVCRQGGYANGGLMPWVGGELCRAAFRFGAAGYGVELLRQYTDHLRRTGGAQVWYWPDGQAGFRTPNEVGYAGWGMAPWLQALTEGLAGVTSEAPLLREVEITPRWPAADIDRARVTVHLAASNAYVAYDYRVDAGNRTIRIALTGSGNSIALSIPPPQGWRVKTIACDDNPMPFTTDPDGTAHVQVDLAPPVDPFRSGQNCRFFVASLVASVDDKVTDKARDKVCDKD
jgi:hypothetical protein